MNTIEKFNEKQVQNLSANKEKYCSFKPGDTVVVSYKITEGSTTRIQNFEGVVIAKSGQQKSYNSSFVVRKISHGVGVERKFLFHSPLIENIVLLNKGVVRRGKLYYLRDLKGKSARIKKKVDDKKVGTL